MEICVSVYTNNTFVDHSLVYSEFATNNLKVLSIYEPRNADYSKLNRTYVTYQIALHRSIPWGMPQQWRLDKSFDLPDHWMYEHGQCVFIHSYELPVDDALVRTLCSPFGTVLKTEYKHALSFGHYHAKVTMSCPIMAHALVQLKNGCIHNDKCIFINFNSEPFTS